MPQNWEKTYFDWMENIQPWCISRQLWWGHQIPAWYGPDDKVFVAETEDEALADALAYYVVNDVLTQEEADKIAESADRRASFLKRDEDVLDTWFSSALWPFSTLGWPDETPEVKRYYPTNTLVTGFDIIFFWVARMMMMGLHFMKEVPFSDVYIHALVRDERGAKMSKSKGNVIDPLALIDEYGADALRFTLAAMAAQGSDIKLSTQRVEGYRNFATKLWNAARFAEMNDAAMVPGFDPRLATETLNKWIAHELAKAGREITEAIDAYKFNEAAGAAYRFVWNVYCDWYLELVKPVLMGPDGAAKSRDARDGRLGARRGAQAAAPVHAVHHRGTVGASRRPRRAPALLALGEWPAHDGLDNPAAEAEIGWVVDLVSAIRSVRAEMNISAPTPLALVNASERNARARATAGPTSSSAPRACRRCPTPTPHPRARCNWSCATRSPRCRSRASSTSRPSRRGSPRRSPRPTPTSSASTPSSAIRTSCARRRRRSSTARRRSARKPKAAAPRSSKRWSG